MALDTSMFWKLFPGDVTSAQANVSDPNIVYAWREKKDQMDVVLAELRME